MIDKLKLWAENVSKNKKGIDKRIFDDLLKSVYSRLETSGYDNTIMWLKKNVESTNTQYQGVHFLATNSKQIKDKLWSLNK